MKGFTLTLAFGKYGGFHAHAHSTNWRICLGWVALTMYFLDLEEFINYLRAKKGGSDAQQTK